MSKTSSTEFDLLDADTIAAVPDLRDPSGPRRPIHEAVAFHRRLEATRLRLIDELRTLPSDGAPLRRFSAAEDARALLAGTPVDSLTAPSASDRRATATRQLHAIEAALGAAQVRIGDTTRRVVAEQCERIAPAARAVLGDLVDAAEHWLACLRAWQQFLRLCDVRGMQLADGRPSWMQLQLLETALAQGMPRMVSLERYIQERREGAGLGKETI